MKVTSESLWNNLNKELYAYIISKVKDKDISNDVLQDAFIKMHTNLHALKNPLLSKQWAYQITRNVINDHFRKQKKCIDIDSIDVHEEHTVVSNAPQFGICLNSFINHLPRKYEEAITLVELQNVSQVDLAKKLNISYSAVKSRVQRARELLKKKFRACCNVSTDKYGNIVSFNNKSACLTCNI